MNEGPFSGTYLQGVRVLEVANELGEYAGKLLAGLGADVVKVEPPQGEETRSYGPFYKDEPNRERSLFFWHYNHGKRGITLDLDTEAGRKRFTELAAAADVVIDAYPKDYLVSRGLGFEDLKKVNPSLLFARISPFGDDGPWADYASSDLVHLALGGMAINSGYDPDPNMFYDTPPVAPQMWHAYHVGGEYTVISLLAALSHRLSSGTGQYLSTSIHHANATNTESDVPMWVSLRAPVFRQTGRHASSIIGSPSQTATKDGRYILPYTTYAKNFPSSWEVDVATLRKYKMQADLDDPQYEDEGYRVAHSAHISDVMAKLIGRFTWDREFWREMVDQGLTWAPVRKPEENLDDEHWKQRDLFTVVEHPELGESFTYIGARWVSKQAAWKVDRRAPLLGEHNDEVAEDWIGSKTSHSLVYVRKPEAEPLISKLGKPFPLSGIRVVDMGWMLASAGAGRYLAAAGAEVIKVEHVSRLDGMRYTPFLYPQGGRAVRDAATEPINPGQQVSINQSANYHEINTGKMAISLNLRDDRARKILEDLIRDADIILEGYSPGTMDRMGLGYERLKELNPKIIYAQQSGLGQLGTYPTAKAFGPTAQAFSGITEMSGFPTPWPPAGIGYSYLDWFGAYNMTTAILSALYFRNITGESVYIDASQVETGIYLTGTAILDYTVNGRHWERIGNRSPYKPAAPSGIYRVESETADRWLAISNFTEEQWQATVEVLGSPAWAKDERFATLEARLAHQDELDKLITGETVTWEPYKLMEALQAKGVPAGVAQTAQDRIENDPQLGHLGFQVELKQTEYGVWPAKAHPTRLSETPFYNGGRKDRHGPNYGEDNAEVLAGLGYTAEQIEQFTEEKVL